MTLYARPITQLLSGKWRDPVTKRSFGFLDAMSAGGCCQPRPASYRVETASPLQLTAMLDWVKNYTLLHLQQICSKHSPIGCRARAIPTLQYGRRCARLGRVFEFLQAPVEIARIDRPDTGVDDSRDPLRLPRRDA